MEFTGGGRPDLRRVSDVATDDGSVIEIGRTYTATFWVRVSQARRASAAFQDAHSPYEIYLNQDVNVGQTWQFVTVSRVTPFTNGDARFTFKLGAALGTVWIDNVSVTP